MGQAADRLHALLGCSKGLGIRSVVNRRLHVSVWSAVHRPVTPRDQPPIVDGTNVADVGVPFSAEPFVSDFGSVRALILTNRKRAKFVLSQGRKLLQGN
jgi:hypothetical protein